MTGRGDDDVVGHRFQLAERTAMHLTVRNNGSGVLARMGSAVLRHLREIGDEFADRFLQRKNAPNCTTLNSATGSEQSAVQAQA